MIWTVAGVGCDEIVRANPRGRSYSRWHERIAFGNSLSEKRRESGFSQEELGLKIGKSSNAVSRYENAENTMDVHTFAKAVNILKVSPYELLKELNPPEPDNKLTSLFFRLQRLDEKDQKTVVATMEILIENLAGA